MADRESLRGDLEELSERFRDDEFSADLYRALTNTAWRKGGDRVSLSWSEAERLVNELREDAGREPIALAQSGGEGDVSDVVEDELGRLGWKPHPLDTGTHDPAHVTRDEATPPPGGAGAEQAPVDDPGRWEREAHRAADENLGRRPRDDA